MAGKKIALVYDAIYPFIKGGAERRFYELGKRLAAQGNDVHLYGMKLWDGPNIIERDGMTLHGIAKGRALYNADGKRIISQPLFFGLAAFKLLGESFDVIDCCGFPYFSLFPAKLAALIKRKPLYATWHEVWGHKYWGEYLGKLGMVGFVVEWLASRLPNKIIACSDQTADRLRTELGVKRPIAVVPNGIDAKQMSDIAPAKHKSSVVYLGRLMPYKNVNLLIESLAVLKKQGQIVDATIIGDGPERKSLEALAKKRGIAKQVTFTGFLEDSKDAYALLKAARVFVLPSQREGFGIVALEANACGLPVLTLDHPENAARHMVASGKNGRMFRQDAADLDGAISETLSGDRDAARKAATAYAAGFDWDALSLRMEQEYQK